MTNDTDPAGCYVEETFERDTNYINDRITVDGRDGWTVDADRYRLIVARACPWAHRATIVRRLLGLESAMSLGIAHPTHGEKSWNFNRDKDGRDPVLNIHRLREAYDARFGSYPRGITVPAMVEVASGHVVTNDYAQLTLDFATEWTAFHRPGAPDLYPHALRDDIDALNKVIYHEVNNGVYRAGFAGTQQAYQEAYDTLFARLDWLENHLSTRRYLVGEHLSEADVRLFTTLVRFDAVYHNHFKCNRNKLTEMPVLWAYVRDLYQTPGFYDTVDFVEIKQHYFEVHTDLNPTRVIPSGPRLEGWLAPHGREQLGGTPFGKGTPPGPVTPSEAVPAANNPVLL
jgi:putative glutathione S-transferase